MYVPFEPMTRKEERTGRDVVEGYAPGAHIKRLLSEGAMYTSGPQGVIPEQNAELTNTEMALRVENEQFARELQELRAKMENDQSIPNSKKTR